MKNKGYYIGKLICTSLILIFLFNVFINTPYFSSRIIIIPFLICSSIEIIKTFLLIMNKNKLAKIFNKLYMVSFLFYWFGFLAYWCYINFISKNYLLLVLSIPFWMIGIYIVHKYFFKRNKIADKSKSKYNFKVIISSLLVGICFLSGIIMLFFGIKDTYKLNKITKDYVTTNGYFTNYEFFENDNNKTTYKLIYTYKVDGIKYTIKTDYGTNYIPDKNSLKKIKYNPENPEESILVGTNSKNALIYMGAFFIVVSFTFVLGFFTVLGYFDKLKIDIIGTYIGIIFFIIGIGIIAFQTGITGSLMESIKSFGFWTLIPFMFIIIGMFQTIKCLFLSKRKVYNK